MQVILSEQLIEYGMKCASIYSIFSAPVEYDYLPQIVNRYKNTTFHSERIKILLNASLMCGIIFGDKSKCFQTYGGSNDYPASF